MLGWLQALVCLRCNDTSLSKDIGRETSKPDFISINGERIDKSIESLSMA